jgi:hypothetical protein
MTGLSSQGKPEWASMSMAISMELCLVIFMWFILASLDRLAA